MNHLVNIVKSDGTSQLFEEEKLVNSLKRVGTSPEAIDDVVDQVEKEMKEGMTTADIYNRAFFLLKKHSVPLAAKYSIRRALLELGPDGFPFERFVARIFNMWGYEAVTDQNVMGQCVSHEVDVVAWKDDSLAMVEAKFHNVFGMKSDLKVALYVKARFDDLAPQDFDYGGRKRKLTERWLITNTKFTDKAVVYGTCHHLRLVGWNYPNVGNLHEIINKNGMQPVTCLTTITRDQKKELIGQNVLVCADIVKTPEVLRKIGIKEDAVAGIVAECKVIIESAK